MITGTPPMRCLTCKLLLAARRHEDDPLDDRPAANAESFLLYVNQFYGWIELVQLITDCEYILQRAYHPLPEWVSDRLAERSAE